MQSSSDQVKETTRAWPTAVLIAYFAVALALGGASRGSFEKHALLQALAICILVWRVADPRFPRMTLRTRLPVIGLCLVGVTAILQLVPLPAEVWTHLPGREQVSAGFAIVQTPPPPLPLSMTPDATFETLLGILPPLAAFTLACAIDWHRQPAWILYWLGGVVIISVVVGIAQILTGLNSPFYLHAYTNRGLPVGFFANANHQALFLLACAPILAVAGSTGGRRAAASGRVVAATLMALGLTAIGVGVAGSLAGWILSAPVILFCIFTFARGLPWWSRLLVLVGAIGSAIALGLLVVSSPILSDKGVGLAQGDRGAMTRLATAETTLSLISQTFPYGTGLGSFERVYRLQEDPLAVDAVFMNHAHNDYLEFVLDAGVAGLVIALMAGVWLITQTLAVWLTPRSPEIRLARASSISLALIALHSAVDYPLRTPALACLAAVLAAILCTRLRSNATNKVGSQEDAGATPLRRLQL